MSTTAGDLLLPEGACLLHIGPYKTGSTAIQASMHGAREQMLEHGVLYPGTGHRATRAGWGLIGQTPRGRRAATIAEWEALVDEVRGAPELRVCVSTEDFGRVGPKHVARIVDDLGPDRLHVLAVVRRLDRLLPSQWQQRAQSFHSLTYEEYLREVLAERLEHPSARAFWASHRVEATVDRWLAQLGAERFTLLVADESDRDLLPRTFEAMLGLPAGLLRADGRSNPSLTYNGIELLRRVNEEFAAHEWPDRLYRQMVQSGMVGAVRHAPRSPHDVPIPTLPAWAEQRVTELSAARAAAVAALPVRVVGDPRQLATVEPGPGAASASPPASIGMDAAVAAVGGALEGAVTLLEGDERRRARVLEPARQRASASIEETSTRGLLTVAARRGVRRLTESRRFRRGGRR